MKGGCFEVLSKKLPAESVSVADEENLILTVADFNGCFLPSVTLPEIFDWANVVTQTVKTNNAHIKIVPDSFIT
jgi:hypothetical protein